MALFKEGYDSRTILCPKCMDLPPDGEDLAAYLDGYMESLPEEVRVSAEVYASRLLFCAECENRVMYTCIKCGCYVQARAAKRELDCPLSGDKKWKNE